MVRRKIKAEALDALSTLPPPLRIIIAQSILSPTRALCPASSSILTMPVLVLVVHSLMSAESYDEKGAL